MKIIVILAPVWKILWVEDWISTLIYIYLIISYDLNCGDIVHDTAFSSLDLGAFPQPVEAEPIPNNVSQPEDEEGWTIFYTGI